MHVCVADRDGALTTAPRRYRPAARSGGRTVPLSLDDLIPLPSEATIVHLPDRTAIALDAKGDEVTVEGGSLPVAAVLPVGYLRTGLPASRPCPGAARLPLFGYAAVADHDGRLMVAALPSDSFSWWYPARYGGTDLPGAVAAARRALPGNRLVDHLSVCALENRCYTAQNTFYRRYEGALPASPACNADCLGCISLQPGEVPTPQPRMRFAPTPDELAGLAGYHLTGGDAAIVSFGQGCEGEPHTRARALEPAIRRIRSEHPHATIHINTNGSRPAALRRLIDAGCNSVRVSAISFTDPVFRAYYRPVGYGLDEVLECGAAMAAAAGQVCLNLLTFPGVTDVPGEIDATISACRSMGVRQIQWRSLNVDHDWLISELPTMSEGIGLNRMRQRFRLELPDVEHGNFTRPWPAAG